MNLFNAARRYFEVKTAFNIDKFQFQSLVSTAHKLTLMARAINRGDLTIALNLSEAASAYWVGRVMKMGIFCEHHAEFQKVIDVIDANGAKFGRTNGHDAFCQYILLASPTTKQPLVMNLVSGDVGAPEYTHQESAPTASSIIKIGGKHLPIYDFTRIECRKSVSIVSGCYPVS